VNQIFILIMKANIQKQNDFLPTGYRVPDKKDQFMKLSVGENNVRVLSTPIMGYVVFNEDKQPIRRNMEAGDFTNEDLEKLRAKRGEDGKFEGSRHFWLMLVWDYNTNTPKILEVKQVSILKAMYALFNNEKWGDPRSYDININREGTGKTDTKFTVTPEPPSEPAKSIIQTLEQIEKKQLCRLEAIWENEYPFELYNF